MHLKPQLLRGLALGTVMLGMAAPHSQAQTADKKTAVSLFGSGYQYKGNYGSYFWDGSNTNGGPGISLNRYVSSGLDMGVALGYVELKGSQPLNPANKFSTNVINGNLTFKFKLNNGWALKEDARIQPYLMVAPGLAYFSRDATYRGTTTDESSTNFDLFGAAGINFRLSDGVGLFIQTGQHIPFGGNIDGDLVRDDNRIDDRYLQHSAGLTFAFGQMKDEDKDGVSDKKDKCPGTPAGVAVDPNGCPLDKDGDGVPDYQDKCPDEKGLAALEGCPDRDGDGVRDSEDKCPDTPGKAELGGCPDADNDGVIDQNDKCPDTPAGVKVDANGCPLDRDGDGVPDFQDRCPDRAGPASNRGCPEVKAETKKRLQEATKYINFEFNKAVLLPSSYPTLQDLAKIMAEYPDYTLGISGHTDSKGADNYNLRLSDDRAASARAYMLSQAVPADRIVSHGYGETKPIADNATAKGQALNRRVEFDLYLTGDPNASEVKYGPAPTIAPEPVKAAPVKKAPAKKAPARKAPVKRK
ncbi:OmpA family protein [Hymenobacter sp. BT683]|uniref:OmpA family protein n=1 Tax=Hymenobacter jeongseonensis TaxID=2791027 RepID=A0ABS0IFT1_9BACT|nr:OmpA family protein [Hymenobacter jeongseonensis]MBF9237027.1 OmpA family protein [Hymenobacter jeongseonensis]